MRGSLSGVRPLADERLAVLDRPEKLAIGQRLGRCRCWKCVFPKKGREVVATVVIGLEQEQFVALDLDEQFGQFAR